MERVELDQRGDVLVELFYYSRTSEKCLKICVQMKDIEFIALVDGWSLITVARPYQGAPHQGLLFRRLVDTAENSK